MSSNSTRRRNVSLRTSVTGLRAAVVQQRPLLAESLQHRDKETERLFTSESLVSFLKLRFLILTQFSEGQFDV